MACVYDSIIGRALLGILVVLLTLTGTGAKAGLNHKAGPGYFKTGTGAIFTGAASAMSGVCAVDQCWTPSKQDITRLEEDMLTFLASSTVYGSGRILENITEYKRKYFGFKQNGKQFILVSALCKKYWHPASKNFASPKRPMTDMGSCFFSVDYDVKARKFLDLYVDGEA